MPSITHYGPNHTGAGTRMIFYKAQKAYAMGKKAHYLPFEPILLACNEAVDSCLNRDRSRALHAVSYLYRMLDFRNSPQQSAELAKLYDYCEQLISADDFQGAVHILDRLRGTWGRIVGVAGGVASLA